MPKTHVRKGDTVLVLTGKDKGKQGKVTAVDPKAQRVVVDGVNLAKRHRKPRPPASPQGGIEEKTMPIHISNVMLMDLKKKEPTRTRYKTEGDKKVRVSAKTGEKI